jgi:hypothetical protein
LLPLSALAIALARRIALARFACDNFSANYSYAFDFSDFAAVRDSIVTAKDNDFIALARYCLWVFVHAVTIRIARHLSIPTLKIF